LQPSELSQELLETSNVPIQNPDLIRILNETSISKTPWAIGFRATIYLGQWPLNYESEATSVNWQYQKVNTNHYDNRSGKSQQQMHYNH
ncbi:YfkD family protein, partial [Escherichia coli]